MMKLAVLCIFDRKAETFFTPYFQTTVAHAERAFRDEVNRSAADNILYQHPEDFELHQLGWFDTSDGSFEIKRRVLCDGRQAVVAAPAEGQQRLRGV